MKDRPMHIDYEVTGPKKGYKYRSEKPSKFNKDYQQIQKNALNKKRRRNNK